MSDFCLELSIYLIYIWFKQCKQSDGLYSEKKSVEGILDDDPWKLSRVSVRDTFVYDFRTNYLQDTLI